MDRKSKYLIRGLILIFFVSAYWGYQVFVVQRDFIVNSTATCDPQIESCFVSCDAGRCGTDYYTKITKRAYNIPICNGILEKCEPLVCEPGEIDCEITFCSSESVEEGERCTNPLNFMIGTENTESTSTETTI